MKKEITELLSRGKGPGLHWFPEDVALSSLAETLVGMANTQGGTVLLGIAPRSSEIVGLANPQAARDRVFQAALLAEPVLVLPIPRTLQLDEREDGSQVLWVTVPSGLPHVYVLDGRYLGREGSQTNPLSARRLRQLLVERRVVQFETLIPSASTLDDLDSQQILEYYRSVHGGESAGLDTAFEFLYHRGVLYRVDGELRPTNAALLLFGCYPQQSLPNGGILAARFPEQSMSDTFLKQELTGTLPVQLRQAEAFVRANLPRVVRMEGLAHEERPEIPFEAVRELLVNAAAHRDYNLQGDNIHLYIFSDRLEIHSPGGLPGPVTLENLLEARFSRNPILVQVLSDLGFVERLGYGLKRVVNVMQKAGLRPPRFEEIGGSFRVTLYNALLYNTSWADLSHTLLPEVLQSQEFSLRQRMALGYLARNQRITNSAYQELCPDVHAETLRRDLAELVSKGILIKVGDKKSTYYILKKPLSR
jgi:ATP-dependent DNA helicase RecG